MYGRMDCAYVCTIWMSLSSSGKQCSGVHAADGIDTYVHIWQMADLMVAPQARYLRAGHDGAAG